MPTLLKIPSGLQRVVNGESTIELAGGTLGDALSRLDREFPGLKERLLDESGEVRAFINIFVNGNDITYLQGLHTPLSEGDEVDIVPSIAGGSAPRPAG